jgi:hypothetical protein
MTKNIKDFSNWPDWGDTDWQDCICISLSRIRDEKAQRELTSIEKEILEAMEKEGFASIMPPEEYLKDLPIIKK